MTNILGTESTRERILLSYLELASKKGISKTSMQDVASAVGIRKASLYSHYQSKDEMLHELYQMIRSWAFDQSYPIDILAQKMTAQELLKKGVTMYQESNSKPYMSMYYQLLEREKFNHPMGAQLYLDEANKMLGQIEKVLISLVSLGKLNIPSIGLAAIEFSATTKFLLECASLKRVSNTTSDYEIEEAHSRVFSYIEDFCMKYR